MKEIKKADSSIKKLLKPQTPQEGTEYVPSLFTLPFSHQGKSYVFHTLTKQCLEAVLPEACSAGMGYDALIETYFLVPRGKDELALYAGILALMKVYGRREAIRTYTILPTFACNARCVYCYEEGSVPLTMSAETEEQLVRYILDTCEKDKPLLIRWFGGEPLLCVNTIDRVSRALTEAGVDFSSSMVSNGSLITSEIVEKMTGPWKLRDIQISMDGAEEDYRRRKRYIEYRGTYRGVMEAVSCMSAAGISVSIRCNVDEENLPSIPRYLEDMREGVENKERVSIYLSPLYGARYGENDLQIWREVLSLAPRIKAAGFRSLSEGDSALEFRIDHCMADKGFPVIAPDGSLYPCEHCPPETRYGDIRTGVTDGKARSEYCRTDRIREKCRGCAFLPLCTPFATCPIGDLYCKQVQEMLTLKALHRLAEKADREEDGSSESPPAC